MDSCNCLNELENFPFFELSTLDKLNYDQMNEMIFILWHHVQNDNFYNNVNKCVNYTLTFVIDYIEILATEKGAENILLSVLELFQVLIERIKLNSKLPHLGVYQQRILNVLTSVFQHSEEKNVASQAGKVSLEFLDTDNLNIKINKRVIQFIYLLLNKLEKHARLIRICLVRKLLTEDKEKILLIWIEENCADILEMESNEHYVLEILKSMQLYYESGIGKLKWLELLTKLFKCRQNVLLRAITEDILCKIVEDFYLTPTYLWPGGRTKLLDAVKKLPITYEQWDLGYSDIFFVFAYLQMQTNKCAWNSKSILDAMSFYVWNNQLFSRILLKAFLLLYPLLQLQMDDKDYSHVGMFLLNCLRTAKSLLDLIDFRQIQLKWLINAADAKLRCRIMNYWLETTEDDNIISFFKTNKMEWIFSEILVLLRLSPYTNRLANMALQLNVYDEEDRKDIVSDVLLAPKNENVSALIINDEYIYTKQLVSKFQIYLSEVKLIPSLSHYCLSNFKKLQNKSLALELFCYYPTTLKELILQCFNSEKSVSVAAFNMVDYLLTVQVEYNFTMPYSITFDFIKLLVDHPYLYRKSLNMLLRILTHKKELLLTCDQKLTLGLFHLILFLLFKNNFNAVLFRILKRLILFNSDLVISGSISHCIFDISIRKLNNESQIHFLEFLKVWLKLRRDKSTNGYIPIDAINGILYQYRSKHKVNSFIHNM
ncbi:hypothetical protein FQR65_LT15412 [Abscondita terminalis]|nr:hypothetical protein FQR65_LT15412 [Abscondita terminalis]